MNKNTSWDTGGGYFEFKTPEDVKKWHKFADKWAGEVRKQAIREILVELTDWCISNKIRVLAKADSRIKGVDSIDIYIAENMDTKLLEIKDKHNIESMDEFIKKEGL